MSGEETRKFYLRIYGELLEKARKIIWFAVTRGDIDIGVATRARGVLDVFEGEFTRLIDRWSPNLHSTIARELDEMWASALSIADMYLQISKVLDRKV